MKVGQLVVYTDWESTGGFGKPTDVVGIIVDIPESKTLPPLIEVMIPSGPIVIHSDEVVCINE